MNAPFSDAIPAVLWALLVLAAVYDVRERRIPNRLVLAGLMLAGLLHAGSLLAGQPPRAGATAWAPLAGLLAGGATLLPMHLLRACGAGDVKLLGMVGAFLGAPAVLSAALNTLVAGGVMAVVALALTGRWRSMLQRVGPRRDIPPHASSPLSPPPMPMPITSSRLPYAVAIFMGTALTLYRPN
jgi:prepilin peptidase CpaA